MPGQIQTRKAIAMLSIQTTAVVALTASIQHVFATMMNTSVDVAAPVKDDSREQLYDISAIIGLNGVVEGAVTIGMSFATAKSVAQAILGLEEDLSQNDLIDAIGELCNMITGNAKARLGTDGISITVPSVVIGSNHTVAGERQTPLIAIPCNCKLGNFAIRLTLRPVGGAVEAA